MKLLEWLEKNKGTAAMLGGFMSMTAGATWWLAKGGAAAIIASMTALADPEIADTLQGLPAYHERVESALEDVVDRLSDMTRQIEQLSDALDSFRGDNERIVEWSPEHSQRLTDAVGGCYAGESCTVYFRGRRTQAGSACTLVSARPRIVLSDGREFPVEFSPRSVPGQLSTTFETVAIEVEIPAFIDPGLIAVVVLTVYADCPFAPEGAVIEREAFRLTVEIKPKP